MRYILAEYQETAAADVINQLRKSSRDFNEDDREYSAVSLTAPTGAGKTVIATAVIERMFYGDDKRSAVKDSIILWITDDPSLNEQTSRKMLMGSSELKPSQLVTIDESFDQETFDRSTVYFLNIQKLRTSTSYVKSGVDSREYSLWDTIGNTIKRFGSNFIVIVDEAHRGTGTSGRSGRPTIVSRVISGQAGANPPTPIVWGISATPERFDAAMAQAANPPRTRRSVSVPVEQVRDSGLLKDALNIMFPEEEQPSHSTLTRLAVTKLRNMTQRWDEYSLAQNEPHVTPALVIQVPASADVILGETLEIIKETWPELRSTAIANAFGEHTNLEINGQLIRYVAPEDIQDDNTIRVVLFKEALTTGWDCPRAEVMLSFRKAEDATYIAQLIGRMVRTPLARRVQTDDVLNTVSMVLPYFNKAAVDLVTERLTTDDGAPIIIEPNAVICERNKALPDEVFELVAALPTYVIPGKTHSSQVRRLHMLATRLQGDGLVDNAIAVADKVLIDTIERERSLLESNGSLQKIIEDLGEIEFGTVVYSILEQGLSNESEKLDVTVRDVDVLFEGAKRGFRDGLYKIYWAYLTQHFLDEDHPDYVDSFDGKILTSALASHPTVVEAVEHAAANLTQQWLKENSRKIADLPAAAKAAYDVVKSQARVSEETTLTLPDAITAPGGNEIPLYAKHLYATANGYPFKADSSWETTVLDTELRRGDTVAWYRNAKGGTKAICVPYDTAAGEKPMYPDFVFIHEIDGKLRPSIVDPHNHSLADTGPKWRGLANYAEKHGGFYQRVDAVIETPNGEFLRLDLKDSNVRKALRDTATKEEVLEVFKEHGGIYG